MKKVLTICLLGLFLSMTAMADDVTNAVLTALYPSYHTNGATVKKSMVLKYSFPLSMGAYNIESAPDLDGIQWRSFNPGEVLSNSVVFTDGIISSTYHIDAAAIGTQHRYFRLRKP